MNLVTKAITGREAVPGVISPYAALVNFYSAFNSQNSNSMESNWLQTEETSMSNPLGGIKRGWSEITEVYKKLFNGAARVYVEFYDYSIHTTDGLFIAVGRERGSLEINQEKIELAIRTTRIYTLHENQWKQIHHHGSMDNPELLSKYQAVLLRKELVNKMENM